MKKTRALVVLITRGLALLLAAAAAPPSLAQNAPKDLVFVVNRDNSAASLDARDLVDFYEKKKRQWPDGTPVKFIDRDEGSTARRDFLSEYLKQSESDVDLYWYGQKLYTGNSVPIQVPSDGMVLEMVQSFKGAIGYVSASTPIDASRVKVLKITE